MEIISLFNVLTMVMFCTCMSVDELIDVDPRDPVGYDVITTEAYSEDYTNDDYYDSDNSTDVEEIGEYFSDELENQTSEMEIPRQSLELRAAPPEDAEVFEGAWDPGDTKDPTHFKDPGDLRNPTHFRDPPTHFKDPPVEFQKPNLPEPEEVEVIQPPKPNNNKKKNAMRVVMVRPQNGQRRRKQQPNRRRQFNIRRVVRPNNTRPISGFMVNGTRPFRGSGRPTGTRKYHIVRLKNNRRTNVMVRMGNLNRRKQKNRGKIRPGTPLIPQNTPPFITAQPVFPSFVPSFPAANPPFPVNSANSDAVPFRLVKHPDYDFDPNDDP